MRWRAVRCRATSGRSAYDVAISLRLLVFPTAVRDGEDMYDANRELATVTDARGGACCGYDAVGGVTVARYGLAAIDK